MSGTFGKLEAQITVPTGGWTTTVGAGTATIPAGTYYISSIGSGSRDFLDEVATQFASASGTTCVVTISASENGTGIVTITFGVAKAIAWVSTDVRDILGFTANSGSATVHTSSKSAKGIWLPNCPYNAQHAVSATWQGHDEADLRVVENASGYVWAHMGQYKTVLDSLSWEAISKAKTWIADESSGNQSLQQFWRDGVWGITAWGSPAGPIRLHPDAAVDATYVTYKCVGGEVFRPLNVFENYSGTCKVAIPRLVKVPS